MLKDSYETLEDLKKMAAASHSPEIKTLIRLMSTYVESVDARLRAIENPKPPIYLV